MVWYMRLIRKIKVVRMKFGICIMISAICIYRVPKVCRWTGKLEFYVKGGQHDIRSA